GARGRIAAPRIGETPDGRAARDDGQTQSEVVRVAAAGRRRGRSSRHGRARSRSRSIVLTATSARRSLTRSDGATTRGQPSPAAAVQTFTDLYRYRFVLSNLVGRNLKVLYRSMSLGMLWTLLNPLVMVTTLTVVWVVVFGNSLSFAAMVIVALI